MNWRICFKVLKLLLLGGGERAGQLLQSYLAAPRTRNAEQELLARKTLGTMYMNAKKYPEALKALDVSQLKQPLTTSRAKSYERMIKSLHAEVSALTKVE